MLTAVFTLLLLAAGSRCDRVSGTTIPRTPTSPTTTTMNPTHPDLEKAYWELFGIRTTPIEQTTLPWWFFETTTPPNSCYYNGRIFFDGQEVFKHQEGMCITGAYCSSGQLSYFDGRFCFQDPPTTIPATTLPPPTTTTINPTNCFYHGKVYENYEFIETFMIDCDTITIQCHYGQTRHISSGCVRSTQLPPSVWTRPEDLILQPTPPTPNMRPWTRGPDVTTETPTMRPLIAS